MTIPDTRAERLSTAVRSFMDTINDILTAYPDELEHTSNNLLHWSLENFLPFSSFAGGLYAVTTGEREDHEHTKSIVQMGHVAAAVGLQIGEDTDGTPNLTLIITDDDEDDEPTPEPEEHV